MRNGKGQYIKGFHPTTEFKKGNKTNLGNKRPDNVERNKKVFIGKEPWNKDLKGFMSDEMHPNWKGDKVGYHALHHWVNRKLGKPETCEYCGKSGLKGKKIHWANKSQEYKRDLNDWLRLCASCHILYDHKAISIL